MHFVSAVYALSLFLAIRVIASKRPRWEKALLILILAIPVIGPLFYVLVSGASDKHRSELDGKGGGLGRRHLDDALAKSADTPVYWDDHLKYLKEELSRMNQDDIPMNRRDGKLASSKKKKNK